MKHPFPKSWWVQPPMVLAGCYPGSQDPDEADRKLSALLDAGIRCIINLQEPDETGVRGMQFVPYRPHLMELANDRGINIRFEAFAVPDYDIPTPGLMIDILDAIDGAVQDECPAYVHCWGGHGRTATAIGCWLVRHGSSGDDALRRIRQLREHDPSLRAMESPQSSSQRRLVLDWHMHERKG